MPEERTSFSRFFKGKSGIYAWHNKLNGKCYVGSSVNLQARISDYFEPKYRKEKAHLIIVRALVKYGMINFNLIILEFTDSDKNSLLSAEQRYLDTGTFSYNIARIAGNTQGVKHTPEAIEKIRVSKFGSTHSQFTKSLMSETRKGPLNPMFGKSLSQEAKNNISIKNQGNSNAPFLCS